MNPKILKQNILNLLELVLTDMEELGEVSPKVKNKIKKNNKKICKYKKY